MAIIMHVSFRRTRLRSGNCGRIKNRSPVDYLLRKTVYHSFRLSTYCFSPCIAFRKSALVTGDDLPVCKADTEKFDFSDDKMIPFNQLFTSKTFS